MKKVELKEVVKALDLQVVWGSASLKKDVIKPMSSRPAVEIYTGYFDYFEKDRLQVIGSKELAIFNKLSKEEQVSRLHQLFSYNSPAFIFTKNVDVPKVFVEVAIEKEMPILKSNQITSALIGNLHAFLSTKLAVRKNIDGAMLDVFGVGVLIQGVEGIGKSETALELIKRGHLLISGEQTKVYQREAGMLIAESSQITEKFLNIKDIGLVNVVNLFGIGSFRNQKRVQMVVELVRTEDEINNEDVKIFDTNIPHVTILVESGRNIASLVETAALNLQLLNSGLSGEKEYAKRVANHLHGSDE